MRRIALTAAAMAMLAGSAADGMQVDVPLPMIVPQCELIVIAKVVKADEAKTLRQAVMPELNYGGRPWTPKPADLLVRTYTVKIEKIHRDAAGKAKVGDQLELIAKAPPPRQPGLFMADGPTYVTLQQGQSYMLMLRSRGDGKGYYLPNYFKCFSGADTIDKRMPGFERFADVEKWGWGEADPQGLRAAVMVHQPVYALMGMNRQRQKVTSLQLLIALRNTSKKTLHVTANAALKPLSLALATDKDQPIRPGLDLYENVRQPEPRSLPPIEIKPGAVAFIASYGPAAGWSYLATRLPAGKYKITATYKVAAKVPGRPETTPPAKDGDDKDDAADKDDKPLWVGEIRSAPASFEVQLHPSQKPKPTKT